MANWKDVKGYEGLYLVSDEGEVYSLPRIVNNGRGTYVTGGRLLKPGKRAQYYSFVILSDGENIEHKSLHRLVAEAFIPNPNDYPEVNHIDENKTNNRPENLEWCDHKYNNNYGSKATSNRGQKNSQNKFSEDMIKEIKRLYKHGDPEFGTMGLSKKFGISAPHISAIIHGKRWGWLD